jgi:predicted Zn-dependent protease
MLMKPIIRVIAFLLIMQPVAFAQQDLPDFGSPADTVLSKSRERMLGQSIIYQLRMEGVISEDAQLAEYIRLLGAELSSQVNDGDINFAFFMIDDDTINAFAMPGGVIGVNTGLLLATENESELAGVLAHEVSHVTQRHIARALYDQKRSSIMTMATVIAAMLVGTSGNSSGNAAMGVATAAQAANLQRQINFTRAHEFEADRIGMGVLSQAGFNPTGMVSFFEKLSRRESEAAGMIPEMLRTHPSGAGRITEARSRAQQLPRGDRVDSIQYGVAKARIRVLSARRPDEALTYYQVRSESRDPADRYGLALSFMAAGLNDQAERIFRELSLEYPTVISFRIGWAEALAASGADDQAMAVYSQANAFAPRNIPLVISYGEALINAGRPAQAHALLLDLLNNVDPIPEQIELLARAASAEGDLINAHHYMSEYYASIGRLMQAINQLRMALAAPGINSVQRARFNARIAEIEEFIAETERR